MLCSLEHRILELFSQVNQTVEFVRSVANGHEGRWFTGMSSWGFLILTPVYSAELSPPDVRGFFTGLNGVHIGLGYLLAACMGRAFATTAGAEQWRSPLGIYMFFPLLMILIGFFSPESPRWLLLNDREDEAREIVFKLHTVKGDDGFAKHEFHQMKQQTAIDKTLETSWVCQQIWARRCWIRFY